MKKKKKDVILILLRESFDWELWNRCWICFTGREINNKRKKKSKKATKKHEEKEERYSREEM